MLLNNDHKEHLSCYMGYASAPRVSVVLGIGAVTLTHVTGYGINLK